MDEDRHQTIGYVGDHTKCVPRVDGSVREHDVGDRFTNIFPAIEIVGLVDSHLEG